MAIEYFQENNEHSAVFGGRTGSSFMHTAFGPETEVTYGTSGKTEKRRPYAQVSGRHRYSLFAPSFDPHTGEVSRDYLVHKHDQLAEASYDRELTAQEKDAVSAASHILLNKDRTEPEKTAWALEQTRTNPHLAPDKLFEETRPAHTEITSMFSDPSMRTQALTLAGMAYEHYSKAPIISDNELSEHSSRLVRKAMKKGFPVQGGLDNPTARQTNTYTLVPRHVAAEWFEEDYSQRPEVIRSTPRDVARGRQVVREMLRSTRARKPQPVTKKGLSQQFLPGMEEYF